MPMRTQEELSVVGTIGKLEAFVPAHQRGGESRKAPNFRVGLRKEYESVEKVS